MFNATNASRESMRREYSTGWTAASFCEMHTKSPLAEFSSNIRIAPMRDFRLSIAARRFLVGGIHALLFCFGTAAPGAELLKGIVFFTPPSFLQANPITGDPAFVACYTGQNKASGKSSLMLGISKHPVGFDKTGKEHLVDEESLKKEMAGFFNRWKTNGLDITHVSDVRPATVGGQPAFRINFDQLASEKLAHAEHYWIQYNSNMVIWVILSSNSERGLNSLRDSLAELRIVKQMK